ncbi:kinetochore complex Sim4 subunit Fta1-domain-containing protein, partial [Bisporella sp. PMI_857]
SPYPLYDTTFTLHRLSPLYAGANAPLDNTALNQHARTLRDILVGDVLRGVHVGLDLDDVLARVGSLQAVNWRRLLKEDIWVSEHDDATIHSVDNISDTCGILIKISYERASYSAVLLKHAQGEEVYDTTMEEADGFEHFPLLLTRMPGSLRETFTKFLSSTFDTRASILHLGGTYLTDALEKYITSLLTDEDGVSIRSVQAGSMVARIIKDVQIVIGFDVPSTIPSLKTMDFIVAKEEVERLIQTGKNIGEKDTGQPHPFMAAFSDYLNSHLALDITHERVKILRIACGAFVVGSEGKIKLTNPAYIEDSTQRQATRDLIENLIEIARGRTIL